MKILFLSTESSHVHHAYHQRLRMLAAGLNSVGIETDFLYLRDLYPGRPFLLQPLYGLVRDKYAQGCDIVHGGDTGGTYVAFPFKMQKTIPIVHDIHGDALQDQLLYLSHQPWNPGKIYRVLQARIAELVASRISDYYIVVSEIQRERLLAKGISAERIEVIRNGVDTGLFHPISMDFKENFTFCYAGAMQQYQGIEILVRAFNRLRNCNVRLTMIGFTDKDKRLKKKIQSLLQKDVEFLDKLPQEELIKHLARADVLILPRKDHPCMRYGFPVKFAEYAAMGKPLIVSDVDETAELVLKHNCGLVYKASDCESLMKNIRDAAAMDRSALLDMGKNARRLATDEFEWGKIARKYADFLKRINQARERSSETAIPGA